ncbi:transglycosylase SLT domain-containing protein [Roseobacter fucihabitans]|uniref:transglycosylase SLT domain-containing protein n=1 Tax=Roseobacter fucihabitans TaxID=1537242 RepID=UPI001652EA0A|nr:transglycosylase SLT domain-containing protein [Roseobacter litoralis]
MPNRSDAEDLANQIIGTGKRNIDIGCFQLNYRWHGHAFSSVSEMFDPVSNARYAAEFLSRLFAEKGDWTNAVGAFHSRTHEFSERYKKKYKAIYADLKTQGSGLRHTPPVSSEQNQFPLLKPSTVRPLRGSLVPLGNSGNRRSLVFHGGEI